MPRLAGKIIGARNGSPLVAGTDGNSSSLGSDSIALSSIAKKVCYLEDGDIVVLSSENVEIYNSSGDKANREFVDIGIMEDNGVTRNGVILDTTEFDEDFPLGTVIPGPGTSNELHAKIAREYIGFDPSINFTSQNLTAHRVQQLNNVSRNPLLDVEISEVDINGDGIMD